MIILLKNLLREAKDYNIKSYKDLPDRCRYGFIVWPDLTIGVVETPEGHGKLIYNTLLKNPSIVGGTKADIDNFDFDYHTILDKKGLLTLVHENDLMWIRGMGNPRTLKLAKDISMMYGVEPTHEPNS